MNKKSICEAFCGEVDVRLARLIEVWTALADDLKDEILRLAGYDPTTLTTSTT